MKCDGECIEWQHARTADGYGVKRVNGKNRLAHRLSYEREYGPIPEGMFVCHKCDNPSCVRPDHLFLGTQKDNMRDCAAKGRIKSMKGESCWSSKLTEANVAEIRKRYRKWDRTCSLRALADEFGVDHKTIYYVVSGNGWRCVV